MTCVPVPPTHNHLPLLQLYCAPQKLQSVTDTAVPAFL